MTPKRIGEEWFVDYKLCGEELVAGPFKSNTEAWRWIDQSEGQTTSKSEDRASWAFRHSAMRMKV